MHGAVNPASIATMIAVGTSLLAGLLSLLVAMRSRRGAAVRRDIVVSVLFGIAVVLTLLIVIASERIAVSGLAHAGLLKAALLLTAAFAMVGVVFVLVRGWLESKALGGACRSPQTPRHP